MEETARLWYAMSPPQRGADGAIGARARIPEDSPWFDGHFPDAPVLPAIAQLGMAAAMIARAEGADLALKSVSRAKFKRRIGPGAELLVTARPGGETYHYSYRISEGEDEVSSGNLVLAPKP